MPPLDEERLDVPSQDLDAEDSVLGCVLQSATAIDAVAAEHLDPRDFYRESNGRVWEAVLALYNASQPVDSLLIADKMGFQTGQERAWLHSLTRLVPASSNAAHYARIVKKHAVARRLADAGRAIRDIGSHQFGNIEEMLAEAESQLAAATMVASFAGAKSLGDEDLEEMFTDIRTAYQTKTPRTGRSTGLKSLDKIVRGFWDGQLITLAARPGQGKSALALNFAENFVDRGEAVLFVTLEMGREELRYRSLGRATGIDSTIIEEGAHLTPEQVKKIGPGKVKLQSRKSLYVQDSGISTVASLRAEATRLKRQHDLGLVVVDYVQLMTGTGREDNRTQELSAITRSLKQLAMSLSIPVLILSQMNRAIEARKEKRPMLSDLRESGSIEQDSDVVMFLHDDAAHDPDADAKNIGTTEVIIAKNRKGPSDTVRLTWTRGTHSFKDLGGTA